MRPQNIPQRRIHQVRPRVVADNPRPPLRIRYHRHVIAHAQRLLRHHLVRHQPRNGIESSSHIREQLRFRVVIERAGVRHLSARLRINHGAVEDHLAALPGNQFVDWPKLRVGAVSAASKNDGFNPAILRPRPKIKIWLRLESLRQLRVSRIRRLFRPALPRRPRSSALLLHRPLEPPPINKEGGVTNHIFYKVPRQAIGIVEPESLIASVLSNSKRCATKLLSCVVLYQNRSA